MSPAPYALKPCLTDLLALRHAVGNPGVRVGLSGGTRTGRHRSSATGRGLEFAGLRPYQPGDDPRSLDWRHTARRGRPFTKVFHEERDRPVLILADIGPTMHFGTRGVFKGVQAARAAALLAWSAAAEGDQIGGVVRMCGGLRDVPHQGRDRGALNLIHTLTAPEDAEGETAPSLSAAVARLQRHLRPGCEVFVISDFATLDESVERALHALRRAQRLTLLRIADPLELAAPPPGIYRIEDEGGALEYDLRGAAARDAYDAACQARTTQLAGLGRNLAAQVLTLATHTPATTLPALQRCHR